MDPLGLLVGVDVLGWVAEVAACPLDRGIHTWPPPSTVEGQNLATASRKPISMTELTNFLAGTTWKLDPNDVQ